MCDLPSATLIHQNERSSRLQFWNFLSRWNDDWTEFHSRYSDGHIWGDNSDQYRLNAHLGLREYSSVNRIVPVVNGSLTAPVVSSYVDPFDILGVQFVHAHHVVTIPRAREF